ncbi:hypothetical protein [Paenibacillus whitsoniae]|uniref:Uncharacterized protein n=1 Tax=Paenibacillus whitsoniae TaxID=2496558 RepID=A0A430J7I6_9BACL|nr:hypothetical protein [Paenibacillus whitsoniae]RTE05493.1 hypothetical protein EJQ19_25050 [Paenibacillus whitsoniae]
MFRPNIQQMTTPIRISGAAEVDFCNWKGKSGSAVTEAGVSASHAFAEVVTWFRPEIKQYDRLLLNDDPFQVYEIIEAENVEMRNIWLILKVKRVDAINAMFSQSYTLFRYQTVKDEYNTPVGDQWNEVGSGKCLLSRKSIQADQEHPANVTEEAYILLVDLGVDISGGDLVEIAGAGKYRCSVPYQPIGSNHLEIQVEWSGPI